MKYLYITAVYVFLSILSLSCPAQLYVQPGAQLSGNNNAVICLNNMDIVNNGAVDMLAGSGNLIFTGISNNYISGNNISTFNELDISKSAGSVFLNQPINVASSIQFDGGLLDLNGHDIFLLPGATLINENENSRITGLAGGNVTASNGSVNAPTLYNLGNLGAAITSSQNLGTLIITRIHVPATAGTSSGIQRTYYIEPSNNSSLSATLRFYYFDAELNGKDKNSLALWKSTDGNTWSFVGADNNDVADNYVEKMAINDFSYWTLSDASSPLPTTLISFSATCQNNYAILNWQTGVEQNLSTFIIQHSSDAAVWKDEGSVTANNSATGSTYFWNDRNPSDHQYYRLEILNMDGSYSYSPVFAGGCDDISMPFTVYPNPAENEATVRVSVRQNTKAEFRMLDFAGHVLEFHGWNLQTGVNTYELSNIATLPAGTYIVQLTCDGNNFQQMMVKK